ncbi:hypothetical protein RSOL_125840 [Rhizoctonia solani AG-3 Rhs1AP]|uniref:C2H2-type domain-containing protein n=2 Tax=Rhizoctonia solani AG-3 TaxID=1086053 RepID=A0A074SB96_9AGAM|nr:hypothetical protein RSOL_125840 [Rhizoctonia solani AG-3 Rhs1AP]KEP54168.1 hypothetical protein V565_021120 [Rhizoctonia solani 123E]
MNTPSPSRSFANVADIGNTTLYREYHHLVTSPDPIEGIWYASSSVQAAGWFRSPMYFVDGEEDGVQHVFCWSLSEYKGTVNYLWRVCWNFHSEPVLALCQRFQEHESLPLTINGYLFYTLGPDRRAMWREVKPPTVYHSSLASVALHLSIQLSWFGSSSLGSSVNWPDQPPVSALPDYTYQTTENLVQGSDFYVSPADTPLSSEPTLPSQLSDTSSDVSAGVLHSPDDSEVEQFQGSRPYFYTDAQGNVTLDVPRSLKDRDAVKLFLEKAFAELSKSVRMIKCSLCNNNKVKKDWHVKPSNLERHILAHLRINDHHCPGCKEAFITKDQMVKHIKKKHPALAVRMKIIDRDGGNRTTNLDVTQDRLYSTCPIYGLPL